MTPLRATLATLLTLVVVAVALVTYDTTARILAQLALDYWISE